MSDQSIYLILNGKAAGDEPLREAVDDLRLRGHAIEVRVTWEAGDAGRFAAEAARDGAARLVAAGGDGTLNEVANAVYQSDRCSVCALGVLPYGTANDFATACGIPLDDPRAALALAVEAAPVPIDAGIVNGQLFVNVASGGYGAEVTAQTPQEAKDILGGFAYFLTGLAHVTRLDAKPARLKAPEFEWEGMMQGFSVANGRQAGGGFRVAPDALLDDALFDVTVFPEVSGGELIALAKDMLTSASEARAEQLISCRVPWLELEVDGDLLVNVDGEPFEATSFRFEVLPAQLQMCLPPNAPLQRSPVECR